MNATLVNRRCDCGELMAPEMEHVCFACWLLAPERERGIYIAAKQKAYDLVGTRDRAAFAVAAIEYQAAAAAVVQFGRTHRIAKEEQ